MIKGIATDTELNNQSPEFARHLKNCLLTESLGSPLNEKGFVVHVGKDAIPYDVNGVYVIDEAIVLFSTDNVNSEIGLVENGNYNTIINDSTFTSGKLNFSTTFPIDAQHYLNFNSQRVIAWIDDINEPRILNIDNFKVQELNDIRIFPFANTPDLTFEVKDSGGTLEAGTHQIVVAYANRDGLKTSWFNTNKPLSITDSTLSGGFTQYDGVEAGTITSKAIQINISNADTRFELLRIGVVKTIDSIVTALFVKEIPISEENFTTIYIGSEGTIETITLEEILTPSASFKNAKAIGQVNNKLYLANLTVDEDIDLTEAAINTKLEWIAEPSSAISLASSSGAGGASSKNPEESVGFWPGEVYAFYLVGEKTNGTFTKAFHIPGRAVDDTGFSVGERDKDISPAGTFGKLTDSPMNYEVDSTIKNVVSNITAKGDFGYWENKNESYSSYFSQGSPVDINYSMAREDKYQDQFYAVVKNSEFVNPDGVNGIGEIVVGNSATVTQNNTSYKFQVILEVIQTTLNGEPATGMAFGPLDNGTIGSIEDSLIAETGSISIVGGSVLEGPSFYVANFTREISTYIDYSVYTAQVLNSDIPSGVDLISILPEGLILTLKGLSVGPATAKVLNTKVLPNLTVDITFHDSLTERVGGTSFSVFDSNNILLSGPVRHHRFPTLHQLSTLATFAEVGKINFPRLSVRASNVVIPSELQDRIVKWTITWAKRTPANATVMGQAPYQYAGLDEEDYTSDGSNTGVGKKFSPSIANCVIGNSHSGDTSDGSRNDSQRFIHQEVIKFNSLELIHGKPTMGSLYLRQEVKLKETNAFIDQGVFPTWDAEGSLNKDSGIYRNSNGQDVSQSRRWFLQNQEQQYTVTETRLEDRLREVETYSYQPANTIDLSALGLGCDLRSGEESLYLKVKGGYPTNTVPNFSITPDPDIPALDINIGFRMFGNNSATTVDKTEETFLSTLYQRKDNVYTPFTEQAQVLTENKKDSSSTTGIFYGGDCRNIFTGVKQLAPYAAYADHQNRYSDSNALGAGCMSIRYFGSYSTKNIGLRYLSNAKISSFYFPKVQDFYNGIFDVTLPGDFRTILYSEDYTLVNEYNAIASHNPSTIPSATLLPHTIASSVTNRLEEREISWQTFLSADRYVMPRDKGPIINLQGVSNDRLFIHQRDSLFITRSTTTLKGDITDITLGSGDLFSVTPTETLSTDEGYAGTQHKFACKLTKAGYAFPDAAQGKIFLHNGQQLEEISKNGQRIFFRDNIDKNLLDNPFVGQGITIAYDEKYNRLIVGYRNGLLSYTAKYAPSTQAWGGYDDYFPDFLIQTRRKLYSLKNNLTLANSRGIYEHSVGTYGIYYNVIEDNPTPYPMIIDVVYNPDPYINKIFSSIEWASEVTEENGLQFKEETIDYITLSNNNKTTGRVELEKLVNLAQIHNTNTRNVNEFWSFNNIRDIAVPGIPFKLDFYDNFEIIAANLDYNKPWYRKAKFIDRFLIARFEYSNLFNRKFSFLAHSPIFRKSYR